MDSKGVSHIRSVAEVKIKEPSSARAEYLHSVSHTSLCLWVVQYADER